MRRSLLPILPLVLVASSPGLAAPLAAWDFEDEDLIVDVTSPGNLTNAITSTDGAPTWSSSGNPGGTAVSFKGLTLVGDGFTVPFDASAASAVRLRFSLRPSNTANKWWKVELSVGGGAFSAVGPLVEVSGETWSDYEVSLPGAAGQANVVVRVGVTDSNGDGSGELVQADGSGAPSSAGTLRLDDVILDEGDDEPPPVDAGPLPPPPPPPLITEVAWMGSASDSGDEWVELYNPGPDAIPDLSRYALLDNGSLSPLPAVELAPGAVLVLEGRPSATSLEPPAAVQISLSLTNAGERLRLCPRDPGGDIDEDSCEVANLDRAWPAGSNASKRTMVRVHADLDGSLPSTWVTYPGEPSDVTDSGGVGILGTPGVYEPIVIDPPDDGGVIEDDGGVIVNPDAGPNAPPTLTLLEPSGEVRPDGELTIRYEASDPDGDDTVAVSLFYDRDDGGHDGVEIVRNLPATGSFVWPLHGVPAGSYTVFGVATDDRGEVAYAYAPGRFVVDEGGGGGGAILRVTDPDGVNDVVEGRITVRWEVSLPEGEDGTISLFYDEDDEGEDGEPIIAGLPVRTSEGEEGPRAFLWDPADVPPGAYAVYAVLDWTGGSVSAYSSFVTVGGGGCTCETTDASSGPSLFALAAGVVLVGFARRRRAGRGKGRRGRHRGASC